MIEHLFESPIALLLIQAMIIIPLARALGTLCLKIGQPMVIGEIVAGLLLGPSFLGWVAPDLYHTVFPLQSLNALNLLSQVGLIFFMFLVGLEFNPQLLKGQAQAAMATSHASIVFPFLLGTLLALYFYPKLSDSSVRFTSFALFMGASMSVTAFPVLARILTEKNLIKTKMGALALTCGAVDDITAWLILAFVISVVRATGLEQTLMVLGLTLVYVVVMVVLARPLLGKFERRYSTREGLSQNAVAIVLLILLISSFVTELIGIHALFGAFFLGAIMPNETSFVRNLTEKIEDIAVLFLLPLFFASAGLKTQVGLVNTPELWFFTALVIAVACLGKFGGSFFASRLMGYSWKESGAIGILMNTRGLMELVILSIGLDLGVISPLLFTVLVLMALVTTFMTSPLLSWIYPEELILAEIAEASPKAEKRFTVLVSISLPRSAQGLMTIAAAVAGKEDSRIYALHLVQSNERPSKYVKGIETEPASDPLFPLTQTAQTLGQEVRPLTFYTHHAAIDIVDVARVKKADLILLGWHKPILGGAKLGGTVKAVMAEAGAQVGVFIDRGLKEIRRILVPIVKSPHDQVALALAQRMASQSQAEIFLLRVSTPHSKTSIPSAEERNLDSLTQEKTTLLTRHHTSAIDAVIEEAKQGYDLVIVGVSEEFELGRRLFGLRSEKIAEKCPVSLLIVKQAKLS